MPAALAANWPAIREAAILGATWQAIAHRFPPVTADAARRRAHRERWPLPCRVLRAAQRAHNTPPPDVTPDVTPNTMDTQDTQTVTRTPPGTVPSCHIAPITGQMTTETAGLSLLQRSNTLDANAMGVIERSLSPIKKLKVDGPKDFAVLTRLHRTLAGKDKAGAAINLTMKGLFPVPGHKEAPGALIEISAEERAADPEEGETDEEDVD